ncbi:MAG TPA: hypothetical protein VFQ53_16705 [Kofleriaceae bacterium]|nr:hypothetical protein [Kofleriaceae bacterium]
MKLVALQREVIADAIREQRTTLIHETVVAPSRRWWIAWTIPAAA